LNAVRRHFPAQKRKGAALVCALACLVVVTIMTGVLLRRAALERDRIRAAERQLQAAWLADSALDRAAAALAVSREYKGETWTPAAADIGGPDSGRVAISVQAVDGQPGKRKLTAQADYPADTPYRIRQTKELLLEIDSLPSGDRP
jgi:Tfp pilus assembly protein PilX